MPIQQIAVPAVKAVLQIPGVQRRRQGPGVLSPFLPNGIQTRDKLSVGKSVAGVKTQHLPCAAAQIPGDYGENVEFHLVLFQKLEAVHHPVPGALSPGIHPVFVVQLFGSVQRDPHQKPVFMQKIRPLVVQ